MSSLRCNCYNLPTRHNVQLHAVLSMDGNNDIKRLFQKIFTMIDSEDMFGDSTRITAEARSVSTDSYRDDAIEESQSLLLLHHQNDGHNRVIGNRNDGIDDSEVETQVDNNHVLLGMVKGIKRSMEAMDREMKRMKEQTAAVDKKVSSVLKKT